MKSVVNTYYLLDKIDFINIDSKQGLYFIHWIKSNNFVPIQRILGTDYNGLLYIGKSTNLGKRINNLIVNLKDPSKLKHHFSIKYHKTPLVSLFIKINELGLIIKPFNNPKEYEEKYLLDYNSKFGELPPFNSNF